jgi:hypothetical protein
MKSHRIPANQPQATAHDVAEVGADDRVFPGPIKHVQPHPVPRSHQVVKDKPGPYIAGIGDGSPVLHGVEPTHEGHDATEVSRRAREATHPVEYAPQPKLVDPVPVYIVNDSGPSALDSWDGVAVYATGSMSKVLGRDGRRRRIYLENTSTTATDVVRVGSGNNVSPVVGYPLFPGKHIDVDTSDALFVCMDAGSLSTSITLALFTEMGIPGAG